MSSQTQNSLRNWLYDGVLFVGIAGVFLLFVHYGLGLLYPAPDYDDFCSDRSAYSVQDISKEQCELAGGRWQTNSLSPKPSIPVAGGTTTQAGTTSQHATTTDGFCDRDYQCRQEFEAAESTYDRTAFAILSILGLLTAFWGFRRGADRILGVSVAAGGVLLVLISSVRFWNQAEDLVQFSLLFVILAVFIYTGYKREDD